MVLSTYVVFVLTAFTSLWCVVFFTLRLGVCFTYGGVGNFPVYGLYGNGLERLAWRSNFLFGVGEPNGIKFDVNLDRINISNIFTTRRLTSLNKL